jgi:putative SOS response-associated peptidase YedK
MQSSGQGAALCSNAPHPDCLDLATLAAVCGRFTLHSPGSQLAEHFDLGEVPELRARYNVAPGQDVAVVRAESPECRVLEMRRWGLVPPWAKDPAIGSRMINARSETAASKPAFARALRRRRCLIPADGFYEWSGSKGQRVPFHLSLEEGALFGMAGLYETWHGPGGEVVDSCSILTRDADAVVRAIHERMPVLLPPAAYAAWLDPEPLEPDALEALLGRPREDPLHLCAVSTRVNRVEFDDAACLEPRAAPPQASLF